MNAAGAASLWIMTEAEREDGWCDSGHAFVGREVVRSTSTTEQSIGTIYAWLAPTVEDPYIDETTGKAAPLFKVRFTVGELDGDVEDLELRDVVESLVTVTSVPPAKKRKTKDEAPATKEKPKEEPEEPEEPEEEDDSESDAPREDEGGEDDDSDFDE